MSQILHANDFFALLERSRLISREEIDNIIYRLQLAEVTSPRKVAGKLVEAGELTKSQARKLLSGRTHGLKIDEYRVLYPLGAGGMGYVFAAQSDKDESLVAIKVLADGNRGNTGMLTRLQLEAEAGVRLAHPNILRTFGLHISEDYYGQLHYVVMELVKGVTLRELVALHRPLDIGQVCDIIRQTATGLQHAHEKGLIHRDVKPENLLIRDTGTAKILDFGLAMLDEEDEEFSMAMIVGQDRVGTADFVAPEQAINSYEVDKLADVYSLGCTMYFALAARVPFPDPSIPKKLRGHCREKPTALEEIRPEVPERLAAICRRMMAKHAKNRLSTQRVIDLLEPYAERQSIEFAFDKMLKLRMKYAAKRSDLKSQQPSERTFKPEPIVPPEQQDTVVQKDTVVSPDDDNDE